jgi:Ca-activated chloride channel family protein
MRKLRSQRSAEDYAMIRIHNIVLLHAAAAFLILTTDLAPAEPAVPPCIDDAMIVFDASGSMSGNLDQGIATLRPKIDEVRSALAEILPAATRFRRVGLITYGPGPGNQCNVKLELKPTENAAEPIMQSLEDISPAGKTPLTMGVSTAADVLDYRRKPGVIVLLTDGEETCGASPCELGKELSAQAANLTVHVIAFRTRGFSWTGENGMLDTKCLAEQNRGMYFSAENRDDLVAALKATLECPMISRLSDASK